MSKVIGLFSVLFLEFIICSEAVMARESKSEKLAHAKNLQALIYQIDTRILSGKYNLEKSDIETLQKSFDKVSVKIINKRQVDKIRDDIAKIDSHMELRNFRHYLEKMFFVRLSPSQTLDKKAGQKHYKTYCASCHGVSGDGNGPMASRLNPPPNSLVDAGFSERIAPHMIFNYAVYGLPSGVMKPLGEILNYYDLWNLSYYVTQLAFENKTTNLTSFDKITSFEQLSSKDLIELKQEGLYETDQEKVYIRKILPFQKSLRRR